jgi:hemerythrin superfamily protein
VLFPEFEARCGMGPTGVMRLEHREIEALLEGIGLALPDHAAALALRVELHRVLGDHNRKEEQVLYPMTDRTLSPEQRDSLVRRIQLS